MPRRLLDEYVTVLCLITPHRPHMLTPILAIRLLVMLDPEVVDPKHRDFFLNPLRRVYVDSPQLQSYRQRISDLEGRNQLLTEEKSQLIQRSNKERSDLLHSKSTVEQNYRQRLETSQGQLHRSQEELRSLSTQYNQVLKEKQQQDGIITSLREQLGAANKQLVMYQ